MTAPRIPVDWPVAHDAAPPAHDGPHELTELRGFIPGAGEAWWSECTLEGCTFATEPA